MKVFFLIALLVFSAVSFAEDMAPKNIVIAEYKGIAVTRQVQQYPLQVKEDKVLRVTLEASDSAVYFLIKEEQGQSLLQLHTTEWIGRVPIGNYTVDVFLAGQNTREAEFRLRLEEIMSTVEPNQKPDSDLINTRWRLIQLNGNDVEIAESSSDIYMTLRPEENKVNGYAGCNNFFGTYETSERILRFSNIGATKKACPDLDLETEFLNALQSTEEYRIEGDQLTLYSNSEPIVLFEALYLQ